MGLHVPGTAFFNPGQALRDELTREAARTVLSITRAQQFTPIGRLVDERAIVNAMVALLATGGSTNHLIHWVAVARSAGITIDWNDFAELSAVVPLLARVYPNGSADVNQFQAAGGPGYRDPRAARRRLHARRRAHGAPRRAARIHARAARRTRRRAQRGLERQRCQRRREHPAAGVRAVQPHRRAQAAAGQPGARGAQGVGRARRPPHHRGAGARVRQPGGAAGGLRVR